MLSCIKPSTRYFEFPLRRIPVLEVVCKRLMPSFQCFGGWGGYPTCSRLVTENRTTGHHFTIILFSTRTKLYVTLNKECKLSHVWLIGRLQLWDEDAWKNGSYLLWKQDSLLWGMEPTERTVSCIYFASPTCKAIQ